MHARGPKLGSYVPLCSNEFQKIEVRDFWANKCTLAFLILALIYTKISKRMVNTTNAIWQP